MNILTTVIALVVFFIILIVPHEFGHFITAKMMGVKVNEFAFGMGPAILQKQGKETLYSVRLLPIGGYCALEGENEDTGDPRAFNSKPGWKKIIILVAGVTMNMLTALVIMAGILFYSGYATLTIDGVEPGSPAEKAGLLPYDIITAIDGTKVSSYDELVNELQYYKGGTEVELSVMRLNRGEYSAVTLKLTLGFRKDVQN